MIHTVYSVNLYKYNYKRWLAIANRNHKEYNPVVWLAFANRYLALAYS
jgi:hypothetical protein